MPGVADRRTRSRIDLNLNARVRWFNPLGPIHIADHCGDFDFLSGKQHRPPLLAGGRRVTRGRG
jgi:hypothetical protein